MTPQTRPPASILILRDQVPDNKTQTGTIKYGGITICSLEPSLLDPVNEGHPKIPKGTYPVKLSFSPHFQMMLPELQNVPGRSEILIHAGNSAKDTKECILTGMQQNGETLLASQSALRPLVSWLAQREDQGLETEVVIL